MNRLLISLLSLASYISAQAATLVAEGDSITVAPSGSYALIATQMGPCVPAFTNAAVSGSQLINLEWRGPTNVDPHIVISIRNVLTVLVGANDLLGMSLPNVTNYWTDLKDYYTDRRSAGWLVVACTVLPRTNAAFSAPRETLNALMRSEPSAYDGLVDFAADLSLGQDTNAWNATLYTDGLHPSAICQTNLAAIYRPVVWHVLCPNAPAQVGIGRDFFKKRKGAFF